MTPETGSGMDAVLLCRNVVKTFKGESGIVTALDDVSMEVARGTVTGLVGPDGAGKTTLIRLAAGLLSADSGNLRVLGVDVSRNPREVQARVGYMPQKFGLYEDLTVQENLDLYADLHGIPMGERRERYPELMHMTGLARFTGRLAGRLSGGMKQKLGLACTLVRSPELLLLDEPTVGVDPLSRRELWEIVYRLVREQGITVLLSTSYLDEAERCDRTALLLRGKAPASGPPGDIAALAQGKTFRADTPPDRKPRQLQAAVMTSPGIVDATLEGRKVRFVTTHSGVPEIPALAGLETVEAIPRFEDGFMTLVHHAGYAGDSSIPAPNASEPSPSPLESEMVVEVRDLVKRFGDFCAVDHVSFRVTKGEIFGLLGPNGAGKSTTFRMLCGLLEATGGTLSVAGSDLAHARASARRRIGYVAQKFSLYGQLSVMENLEFFAGAYGLRGQLKKDRIRIAVEEFDLREEVSSMSGRLPEGYKRRLAMACALMHEPDILFLDEPTSGADPTARREFWQHIGALADRGVTIIVTTHFMEEAEYCDHMVVLVDGKILAAGTPADIRERAPQTGTGEPTMEDAFIAVVEEYRAASENSTTG